MYASKSLNTMNGRRIRMSLLKESTQQKDSGKQDNNKKKKTHKQMNNIGDDGRQQSGKGALSGASKVRSRS